MRLRAFVALLLAPPIIACTAGALVYSYFALDVPRPLPDEARAAAMAPLRSVVDGRAPARPDHPALARRLPRGGPAVVSLWIDGRRAVRVEGRGATAADALEDAAKRLAAAPELAALTPARREAGRLQVDLVVARGPLVGTNGILRSLGMVAGMDGFGAYVLDTDVIVGADELVAERLLFAKKPLPFMEFAVGLDFELAEAGLARRAGLPPGMFGGSSRRYFRFRAESFVERPAADRASGPPLPLTRGLPPGPPLSVENLRAAAEAGGDYLVAHLAPSGRYVYEVDLTTGRATEPDNLAAPYSLPRHAGTTYYLAELYEATKDPEVRAGVERAIGHLAELIEAGGCHGTYPTGESWACVTDKGQPRANMGSAALAVVALAEYRLATNDPRYDDMHRALANWIVAMQLPSGRFAHLYDIPSGKRDEKTQLLYFDGEAALAMARSYKVFQDERYLRAAEKALDSLVAWYGEFFIGRFFFGEEHWTCIAAEAAWPDLKHDRYREFCSDYAAFLRTQQFAAGETPSQPDLAGAYGVTPFFVPHNTPVGSRSEAMISAWLLTRHHGRPDERIRKQILNAMEYLLRQQIRADNDWWTPVPAARGGMPGSSIDRIVRIDYVQHACSAMLRSIELLEGTPR